MDLPNSDAATFGLGLLSTRESVAERVRRAYVGERDIVYRYLVSLGIEPADAQELTQDVFLQLYLELRKGLEVRTLRAWLFTVASRMALNLRRSSDRHPTVPAGEDWGHAGAIEQGLSPELALLRREQLAALRVAIRALPRQQQVCLHLRAEGFRYQAIAEIVGVKVPTVSEHLRRALARLRKVIDG